jgi:2,4-dienoyl-CoA reductase (NADPH2)
VPVGERVAIIGAGGIGFDVAELLLGDPEESVSVARFLKTWNVDHSFATAGGIAAATTREPPRRQVFMFQRRSESLGRRLGKSTGWIVKARMARAKVSMIGGVEYERVDDEGLCYTVRGERHQLAVDPVIVCAGQESERSLYDELCRHGATPRLIGGADVAHELDAVTAIDQATRLATTI